MATTLGPGYGFAIVDARIGLPKVLAIYLKGGGQNARHAWTETVTYVSAISYLALQVFEQLTGQFCAIPRALATSGKICPPQHWSFLGPRGKAFAD
ncbi:hypothetical protein F5I97DRAFT_1926485 [Phlebopus sp. FC_14]|nr:hypothetical protein F5I97DRAFT_1926485 [Phlebopus sp. FC_14]